VKEGNVAYSKIHFLLSQKTSVFHQALFPFSFSGEFPPPVCLQVATTSAGVNPFKEL
jgi:hypothetical protein